MREIRSYGGNVNSVSFTEDSRPSRQGSRKYLKSRLRDQGRFDDTDEVVEAICFVATLCRKADVKIWLYAGTPENPTLLMV